MRRHLAGFGLTLCLAALPAGLRADHDPETMSHVGPDQLVWSASPYPGIQVATLYGDPKKEGPYTVRVKFAPHAMSRPHYHPEERTITVIKGPWFAGSGDKFDPDTAVPMATGSFVTHHPKKVHYDGAKDEEVIVQISGIGPSATIFAHPEDDPKNRK